MLESVNKNIKHIVTDDIRTYLRDYQRYLKKYQK